ncbi:MAG: four helix bundle protein [Nitrospirae bacterium]|nr:four helix bundle protein [Nitrospirota bacterium]
MYKSFKEMPIWQDAMEIAVKLFLLTEKLPKKEDYGLTSQIRRSAVSISANIAEAFGRQHIKDTINFCWFSRGSITETMSHLEYAYGVNYFSKDEVADINKKLEVLNNNINKLIKTLNNR